MLPVVVMKAELEFRQEFILANVLVSTVVRIQVDSYKRKCKRHKMEEKSLQESEWILAIFDKILPPESGTY